MQMLELRKQQLCSIEKHVHVMFVQQQSHNRARRRARHRGSITVGIHLVRQMSQWKSVKIYQCKKSPFWGIFCMHIMNIRIKIFLMYYHCHPVAQPRDDKKRFTFFVSNPPQRGGI